MIVRVYKKIMPLDNAVIERSVSLYEKIGRASGRERV